MTTNVFVPTEIKVERDIFTFDPAAHTVEAPEAITGFAITDEVYNAFEQNGYKIRLHKVNGEIQAYIYRYGGYLDDGTIHLAAGESVELRGYADIRKIKPVLA